MKLAIASDLHLPKTPAETINKLVSEIATENPDAIIIAGDMGESSRDTAACLSLFRPIPCPFLVSAGNHDLFPDTHSSKRLWGEILRREVLARQKITHTISGHTHIGKSIQVRNADGRTIKAHIIGSDYRNPAFITINLL